MMVLLTLTNPYYIAPGSMRSSKTPKRIKRDIVITLLVTLESMRTLSVAIKAVLSANDIKVVVEVRIFESLLALISSFDMVSSLVVLLVNTVVVVVITGIAA